MNYKTRKGFAWNFFQRIENIFISIQYLPVSISLASFIPLISISENIEQRCLVPPFGIYHSEKTNVYLKKKGEKMDMDRVQKCKKWWAENNAVRNNFKRLGEHEKSSKTHVNKHVNEARRYSSRYSPHSRG